MTTKTTRRAKPKSATALQRKQLDSSLTNLTHAELIRLLDSRDAEYIFKHALVQDSAYESLLKQERVRLHLAIAQCLEKMHADNLDEIAARLAQHYAEAGDDAKTVEYSERAGDVAARAFANKEAIVHYSRALQTVERIPDTLETRRKQIDLTIKYGEYSWGSGVMREKLAELEKVEAMARSLPEVKVPASPDRMRLAYIHSTQGSAYFARGEIEKAMPYFYRVVEEAAAGNDARILASAAVLIAGVLVFQGHFPQALPYIEQSIAAAREFPHTWYHAAGRVYHAQTLAAFGQFATAIQEVTQLLAEEQAAGYLAGITMSSIVLAMIHSMARHDEQAIAFSNEAIVALQTSNEPLYASIALSGKAMGESRRGKDSAARQDLAQTLALLKQAGGQAFAGDWVMAMCTEAALNLGEIEQALALAQETVNYARQAGGLYAEGIARRSWAHALFQKTPNAWAEIEQQLEMSLNLLEPCEVRPEIARTHFAWGKILLARGETDKAQVHLEKAQELFAACELDVELAETRELWNEVSA